LRLVGPARAKDLIFSGRKINVEEAFSMGLVNKIFSSEDLLAETRTYAKTIVKNSGYAVGISKMLVNRGMDTRLDTGLKMEI
jgi:enoyl-CoA hydratase/carnithine racemase